MPDSTFPSNQSLPVAPSSPPLPDSPAGFPAVPASPIPSPQAHVPSNEVEEDLMPPPVSVSPRPVSSPSLTASPSPASTGIPQVRFALGLPYLAYVNIGSRLQRTPHVSSPYCPNARAYSSSEVCYTFGVPHVLVGDVKAVVHVAVRVAACPLPRCQSSLPMTSHHRMVPYTHGVLHAVTSSTLRQALFGSAEDGVADGAGVAENRLASFLSTVPGPEEAGGMGLAGPDSIIFSDDEGEGGGLW